jgi:hypothetical protein
LGDHAAALVAFDSADELRRRLAAFDLGRFEALAARIIGDFPASRIVASAQSGDVEPRPIFIVGMPRSGTTLCEQILSNHPKTFGAGELPFWDARGRRLDAAGELAADAGVVEAAREYLDILRGLAPGAECVTDKMPFNFLWVGLIARALPGATIIHMRRSPIDTALSIHQTYFSPRIGFPTGGAELVGYYRAYERLMAHWRAALPKGRLVEVDYEALTSDPEPQVRRMLDAVGLDWDAACLHPEDNARVVRTPSKWQAKQPINRGSVGRWRRYEPWLGPLAELVTDEDRALGAPGSTRRRSRAKPP